MRRRPKRKDAENDHGEDEGSAAKERPEAPDMAVGAHPCVECLLMMEKIKCNYKNSSCETS